MKTKNFLTLIVGALFVGLAVYAWLLNSKVKELENQEPVTYADTVTLVDLKYDTVYKTKTKVETLRLVDTCLVSDTVTDSVYVQVEVPIYTYQYDTLFSTDSVKTHLRAVLEGFNVSVDTLSIQWEITHQEPKNLPKKWYNHLAPAVGVGYGTSGFGLFVGLGYAL